MTVYAQLFCTVADLLADSQSPGVDETRLMQAIREASNYLQKEIGLFIPLTATRRFNGQDQNCLLVPPLLNITTIINDADTLTPDDYILKPDLGYWLNGPYGEIWVEPQSNTLLSWSAETDGVQITGRWGNYERTGATGATVADTTQQSDSQSTLKVNNGGRVSLGMVLLIGTEQELVTSWSDPTASVTLLNGAVTAPDEIFTVDDASLINVGEIIRLDFEQCLVRDRRTNQLSVVRGWNGTGRVAHSDNTVLDVYRTVNVERGVNGTTAAAHANGLAISRYFAPDDIQLIAKKMATLIASQAKGGYQSRSGNEQTGVTFYTDIFARFDLEKIKKNYYLPRVA